MASSLINLAMDLEATALVGDNLRFASKKKKSTRDFLKQGTKNLVGITLIKAQANT